MVMERFFGNGIRRATLVDYIDHLGKQPKHLLLGRVRISSSCPSFLYVAIGLADAIEVNIVPFARLMDENDDKSD